MPSPWGLGTSGDLSRIAPVAKAEAGFVPKCVQLLPSLCASLWKERSDPLCSNTLCSEHSPCAQPIQKKVNRVTLSL